MSEHKNAGDDADRSARARKRSQRPRKGGVFRELAIILVSALVLSWAVKTFLVQPFFIPSQSMEDTLIEHDRVLVSKLTPGPFELNRGDVVVFKDPGGWLPPVDDSGTNAVQRALNPVLTAVGLRPQDSGEHLIKRIVGLPGDHVACCSVDGLVSVNDVPITETYVKPGAIPSQVEFDKVVPEGFLWVMGDNRQNSHDSRFTGGNPGGGFVPIDNVVGVAFIKVWPLDRIAIMHNPGDVFSGVPEP